MCRVDPGQDQPRAPAQSNRYSQKVSSAGIMSKQQMIKSQIMPGERCIARISYPASNKRGLVVEFGLALGEGARQRDQQAAREDVRVIV